MRVRHIVVYGLPAVQYFSTLSHKRCDLRKKFVEHKMCVSIFCTTFVCTIFHSRRNERDIKSVQYISLLVKYSLFFSAFNEI
jgi:hypothetical protein